MPPKPVKRLPEAGEPKARAGPRSTTSSKPTSTPGSNSKTSSKPSHPSSSSRHPKLTLELPLRNAPSAKPLDQRQTQELRDHKTQLEEEAKRKKDEENTAWMRRGRYDPITGEKSKPKSTGSSSSDSPIRRVQTPPELPPHWTAEEKANYELLAREGVKVAVFEQHRLNKDKIVKHQDYVTVVWDECKNIDIPWHRFKVRTSPVRIWLDQWATYFYVHNHRVMLTPISRVLQRRLKFSVVSATTLLARR